MVRASNSFLGYLYGGWYRVPLRGQDAKVGWRLEGLDGFHKGQAWIGAEIWIDEFYLISG